MKYSPTRSALLRTRDILFNGVRGLIPSNELKIFYAIESANWSIKWDGIYITEVLNQQTEFTGYVTHSPFFVNNGILHFGSVNIFDNIPNFLLPSVLNRQVVLTWYHLEPDDSRVKKLVRYINQIDTVHTSCTVTRDELVDHGIPTEKIAIVPIGVDTSLFTPGDATTLRQDLGIPEEAFVIGSFQKDGEGWGRGMEPKYVKGPDILAETAEQIHKSYDVHFLLLGPARGYVKSRLEEADIPYVHRFVEDYQDIPKYYQILDAYVITSRSEGGPKAIPESMASGVPLVSTRVGMAPDFIESGINGYLVSHSSEEIADRLGDLIENENKCEQFSRNGLETAQRLDWSRIGSEMADKIYSKI